MDDGDVISLLEVHEGVDVSPPLVTATGMEGPFNREAHHLVQMLGMHQGRQVTLASSVPPKVDTQHIIHIMTPEIQTATHYFWAVGYNRQIDQADARFAPMLQIVAEGAFMEAKVTMEENAELNARDYRPKFREKIIKTDEGGIRVLRLFKRLADTDNSEQRNELLPVSWTPR